MFYQCGHVIEGNNGIQNLIVGICALNLVENSSKELFAGAPGRIGQCRPIGQDQRSSAWAWQQAPRSGVITESRLGNGRPIRLETNLGWKNYLSTRSGGGLFNANTFSELGYKYAFNLICFLRSLVLKTHM